MSTQHRPYILHTNWRSTCSGRLRLALNIKNIPYDAVFVDTSKGEHLTQSYASLNPSRTVPCLQSHDDVVRITQSLAAIEYLEEQETSCVVKLLPPLSDVAGRAHVRTLAYLIAVDVQPLTSSRVLSRIKSLGGNDWSEDIFVHGLRTYESHMSNAAGRYSYGDVVTLADVCLVPAVWKALMYNINVQEAFPAIWRVYQELSKLDAVQAAHWSNQPDCPPELREVQ